MKGKTREEGKPGLDYGEDFYNLLYKMRLGYALKFKPTAQQMPF